MRSMQRVLSAAAVLAAATTSLDPAFADRPKLTADCESALALSALPARLRDTASVYVLRDDRFEMAREGSGPFTCIVERNHPVSLIPQCTDAAGRDSVVPGIVQRSEWVMEELSADARAERFASLVTAGEMVAPPRPGVSYMMSDFSYTWNPSLGDYVKIPPHVMFYAPNLSDEDIGGSMAEGMGTNRGVPFIVQPGIHGFMTSMVEHASESDAVRAACAGQLPDTRIADALASPARFARDRRQDENRHAREFLAFTGIERGDVIADINAGSGYFARMLPAMVGPTGKVHVTNAQWIVDRFDGINGRLKQQLVRFDNVSVSTQENDSVSFDEPLDVAILNNIYHDLHLNDADLGRFNRAVFAALRPGGLFIVGDHKSVSGSGTRDTRALHRIDRELVLSEILAAGFELVEEATFLANAEDTRTLPVFDASLRGRTDRFLFKFRRPAAR